MIVVTMKDSNEIIAITKTISSTVDEGYTRIDDCRFIVKASGYNFHEVEDVPNGILAYKYCYTIEKGFYENPDWVEPSSDIPEEIKETIKQEYRDELAQEVSQNVYDA